MFLKSELSHLFVLAFCVYLNCVFTVDLPSDQVSGKEILKKGNAKPSTVHVEPVELFRANKKSDLAIEIPIEKAGSVADRSKNRDVASNKEVPQLALEGGGIIDLTSTVQPNTSLMDLGTMDDGINHSKGSKPRKGVENPGSSIVPRKGVGVLNLNHSSNSVTSDPIKESTNDVSDSQKPSNKTEQQKVTSDQKQLNEKSTPKVNHPKKPASVTDIEDVDDFDNYPFIQTSTTGEDYIIIGIVIVLGIWCSIFGALIFYRRAGEYWDRRHYRRMDFLVEGMYND